MRTTLQVTTEPSDEPVSLPILKRHCRIDQDSDDVLLAGYLTAARMMAEGYLSRALISQKLLWTMLPDPMSGRDQSRLRGPLELPRAPVTEVASVVALDVWGNTTTIAAAALPITPLAPITGYVADLDLTPARLTIGPETPLTGGSTLRWTKLQHIQVAFGAGYGKPGTVPQNIVNAIMMTAAFLYENRGDAAAEMPQAAQWLLDRDRLQFLGG
jgi:uncharacterized phiE125 gp8 family phage protein